MGDLIDREKLLDSLPKNDTVLSLDVRKIVLDAPAVDAAPVVHGKWKLVGGDKRGRGGIFACSACDKCDPFTRDYCPNCGAKMDGEEDTK